MTVPPTVSRRVMLQAGGAGALTAAVVLATGGPADAQTTTAAPTTAHPTAPTVVDLGPAVVQFALMSATLVGDTLYIGSRNIEPAGVVAYHVPTGKVTAKTTATTGYSVQAMAADPTGRYLYFGVLQKTGGTQPNLFRWDLRTPETPAVAIGAIGDRDVRDVTVAPDGVVFAVGGGNPTAPALWQFDPATAAVTSLGVPDASSTLARAVAATATTVFFGAGSTLGGGGSASRASLFAYDRASRAFTSIVPSEMTGDPSMRELAIVGDRLIASTAASTANSKLASFDLADLSSYTIATSIGATAKNFAADGDIVYFANETGIVAWDRASGTVQQLDVGGVDLGEIWGVDLHIGGLVVTSAYGFVAEIDLSAHTTRTTDLGEAGAPVEAQTCMGLAAGAGYLYVGGNGAVARHALATGDVVNLRFPGEAKDAEVIGGNLYTGQYNAQGVWMYNPRRKDEPRQVVKVPTTQNRPLDTAWDADDRLLVIAAQSDTEGGGSIWTYDPRRGTSTIDINPIDDAQLVRAVATADGMAYLGGDNAQKTGPRGTVVAWNPVRRAERWRIETGQPNGIAALAVLDRHLYALTIKGILVVIDRIRRTVVHMGDHSALVPGFAAMRANRGAVYAVSDTTLFRFDPRTFDAAVVVADTAGGWYSGPHLTTDESGLIYTLRGRNVIRVDDQPGQRARD